MDCIKNVKMKYVLLIWIHHLNLKYPTNYLSKSKKKVLNNISEIQYKKDTIFKKKETHFLYKFRYKKLIYLNNGVEK